MSRSRRGKKAGEDAERLLQEAFGVSEDQLLKDFILAQTEVKKNHPARTLSNCTKKFANHAG